MPNPSWGSERVVHFSAGNGKIKSSASDMLDMSLPFDNRKFLVGICFFPFAGVLLLGDPAPLSSQEAGLAYTTVSSDNPILSEPSGFEFFTSVPLFEWLQMSLSYQRISQDATGQGEVCVRYAPNLSCGIETVRTESAMGSIKLSFLPSIQLGDKLRMGAGGGVSFSSLDATSLGESGRLANLEVPNTGQLGYQALASLSLTPFPSVPVTVVGTVTGLWVNFHACVTYEEIYDPFCGKSRFDEFSAGLAYRF